MARTLRVQYAGAIYHVLNRGDRREAIFKDDKDHLVFLQTLAETCRKTGWQIHAWCLMKNHFHLVMETPQPNLVAGMKWFLGTYTGRFNRRHKVFGHLFSGRYKALAVDGSGNGYLRTVCDYVHLNPVRAGLLGGRKTLADYRWSSFRDYIEAPRRRPEWLRVDRLLGEMGIGADTPAGRREFASQSEERRFRNKRRSGGKSAGAGAWAAAGFGWDCWSGWKENSRSIISGPERQESAEERAERLIAQGLAEAGWTPGEMARRRKSDPVKVALARQLRQETTVTLKWIADRLQMGTWEHLRRLLYETRKGKRS